VHQTGLDGVQVDEADGAAGGCVHHDVIHLGIAVDGAHLELPLLSGVFQNRSPGPTPFDEPEAKIHFG
jgi:hypothetical protein